MKKLTVVGRGIVGCMAVAHYLRWTDWEIDWIYDPNIASNPVGEGTNLAVPKLLAGALALNWKDIEENLDATPKIGIMKRNWGNGKQFLHPFPVGDVGMHMNAISLQDYLFNRLKSNRRVKLIEETFHNSDKLDSDYKMICIGTPKSFDDYVESDYIPVNSCLVSQCSWDYPRFNYSLTNAAKHGWYFGIPLKNRCSIGYLYNDKISTLNEIKEDVDIILNELNLSFDNQNTLKFKNYYKKQNFTENTIYNGNASFFLEPLEATSTGQATQIIRNGFDLWNNNSSLEQINESYIKQLNSNETMICMHYYAGSIYDTPFWTYAKQKAYDKINVELSIDANFRKLLFNAIDLKNIFDPLEYGTWPITSWNINILGLNIKDKLKNI